MGIAMDHIVLNAEDEEKMIDFYHEVLGLQPERLAAYRRGDVPFPSVRINADTIIDFFPKSMWDQTGRDSAARPNMNHLCLVYNKDRWDTLRKQLKAKKVEIETGPVKRWGAHGTGISIYFRDPEKNLVEVRYYEENRDPKPCLLGS